MGYGGEGMNNKNKARLNLFMFGAILLGCGFALSDLIFQPEPQAPVEIIEMSSPRLRITVDGLYYRIHMVLNDMDTIQLCDTLSWGDTNDVKIIYEASGAWHD